MSNMTQLFDASRFPGHVKVQSAGKAAVMTLCGPETGSLRLFSLWDGAVLSFNRIYTQVWPLAQNEAANILLLNFCRKGRWYQTEICRGYRLYAGLWTRSLPLRRPLLGLLCLARKLRGQRHAR